MANYMYIYYNGGDMGDLPMEEVRKAWGDWFEKLGSNLVDAGNPFNDNGMAVERSGVSAIENFPSSGYSIVKADSMEKAVEMTKGCPLLAEKGPKGAAIRVYETLPM
jgi:hypothetical protein